VPPRRAVRRRARLRPRRVPVPARVDLLPAAGARDARAGRRGRHRRCQPPHTRVRRRAAHHGDARAMTTSDVTLSLHTRLAARSDAVDEPFDLLYVYAPDGFAWLEGNQG